MTQDNSLLKNKSHINASKKTWLILWLIIVFGLFFHLWGIKKNIPYSYETDEPGRVVASVYMAATGDLNPGRFRHPGSTVLYPLAGLYHIWGVLVNDGSLFHANLNLQTYYESNPDEFYLIGRYLSVFFGVIGFALTFKLGRYVFDRRVALLAAWLVLLTPFTISHVQLVRTDGASIFFCTLGLWLCYRVYDQPTTTNQVLAGMGIGLSISTKYYLGVLVIVLFLIDLLIYFRRFDSAERYIKKNRINFAVGFMAIPLTFALTSPYVLLDYATAQQNLTKTMHNTHLGADGLTPFGNLLWYLRTAIPTLIFWPQAILFVIGIGFLLRRRQLIQLVLLVFIGFFIVGISFHPLHWARWLFPILPAIALIASYSLDRITIYISKNLQLSSRIEMRIMLIATLFISAWPLYKVVQLAIQQSNPSTRVLAHHWIIENLPPGSRIAQDTYSAPLHGTNFYVFEPLSIAEARELNDYYSEDYQYLVISSQIYNRFFAEPDRYPAEVSFYNELLNDGVLLQQFEPNNFQGGPIISIYDIQFP